MKVLVTGVKGQLGYDVMNELAKRGYEGVGVDVDEMDITDRAAVERVIGDRPMAALTACTRFPPIKNNSCPVNFEILHSVFGMRT